jgi:hypothetical protein
VDDRNPYSPWRDSEASHPNVSWVYSRIARDRVAESLGDGDSDVHLFEKLSKNNSAPSVTLVLSLRIAETTAKTRLCYLQGIATTAVEQTSHVVVTACKHSEQHAALAI